MVLSLSSRHLDFFVRFHACVAFAFASVALFFPETFSYFTKDPSAVSADSVAGDAIRWSSPFIYGFACFAWASLSFPAAVRLSIAKIYIASFSLATTVGLWVQTNGRWNGYHAINLICFGSLAIGYGVFTVSAPHAFERPGPAQVYGSIK
jgi:hypothetical protein